METSHDHSESDAEWKQIALVSAAAGFPATVGNFREGDNTFLADLVLQFLKLLKAEKQQHDQFKLGQTKSGPRTAR